MAPRAASRWARASGRCAVSWCAVGETVHGYLNRCPHAGRQLNFLPDRFLTPDGELIQCLQHGALFEKATRAVHCRALRG